MRIIKFRGKRPSSGKWITGSLIELLGFSYIVNDEHKNADCSTEVLSETVSQFTGLKDKNGKEIFEGDIIKKCSDLIIGNVNITEIKKGKSQHISDCFIEYVDGTFRLNQIGNDLKLYYGALNFTKQCFNHEIEIIGNIHDIELLKD